MKICFSTPAYCIDSLRKDFDELKKEFTLPCKIEEFYAANTKSRLPQEIAVAFYGEKEIKQSYPEIEINPQYFKEDSVARHLILLHEMIHCFQRVQELSKINKKYFVDGTQKFNDKIDEYISKHGKDHNLDKFRIMAYNIGMFSTWIFEIWDELYLKKKYPAYYEKKLKLTFQRINSQYSETEYNEFGILAKYPIFIQLSRAYHLKKISKGTKVSENFCELYDKWKNRLSKVTNSQEYGKLMSYIDLLANFDGFENSDTSNLEKVYDEVIELMKNL